MSLFKIDQAFAEVQRATSLQALAEKDGTKRLDDMWRKSAEKCAQVQERRGWETLYSGGVTAVFTGAAGLGSIQGYEWIKPAAEGVATATQTAGRYFGCATDAEETLKRQEMTRKELQRQGRSDANSKATQARDDLANKIDQIRSQWTRAISAGG